MTADAKLTSTDLIAASTRVLVDGGYSEIREGFSEWTSASTRLFEDEYNVVGIAVFETIGDLIASWADLQGSLVKVISERIGKVEKKAWDGYLVLLTIGSAPQGNAEIEAIRYNTTRLRKLVATREHLIAASDVERVLRPLLPLGLEHSVVSQPSALDLLPGLLEERGISGNETKSIVESFVNQKPLMEELHAQRGQNED